MKVFRPKESEPDGPLSWQRLRKGVADLRRRAELSHASNERYLEDLASVEHSESLGQTLANLCRPTTRNGRRVRALNPFHSDDAQLLAIINQGEFSILGFRNRDLKQRLFGDQVRATHTKAGRRQSGKVTRLLTLLKSHHLIKKVPRTHRYVLTEKGQLTITAILAAQHASTKRLAQLAV